MKTISLKIPEEVCEKRERYRKEENLNRSNYVVEALIEYNKKQEREELRKKLEEESKISSREYRKFREEMEEWNTTLMDGLEDPDHD